MRRGHAWRVALPALALLAGCTPASLGAAARAPEATANTLIRVPAPRATPSIMPVTTPIVRSIDGAIGPEATAPALGRSALPVRIHIPSIGVDASVTNLGLESDGTIQVPSDPRQAGWYRLGPVPGDAGPAVILGHLDSTTGPAVFARLAGLRVGDQVLVARADGSQVRFQVDRVATFSVSSFPTEAVYGATPDPVLRLITCSGTFNRAQGRYLSNVVVFATEAV